MLNKKNRLTTNSSFVATYHQNRVVSDEFFVLHAGRNKNENEYDTKIGFIVSKKVHKRAVIRNRIKRHMREIMRTYLNENNPPYLSLILTAKAESKELNFNDTLTSVYKLLDRLAKKKF